MPRKSAHMVRKGHKVVIFGTTYQVSGVRVDGDIIVIELEGREPIRRTPNAKLEVTR